MMDKAIPQSRPGGDYNQLPYVSMPVVYSQPSRLAALAALYGLKAPEVETARVLEIGCASGGNIIPLAARFPKSRFLGVDLSATHIDIARQSIAKLGVTNIEMRQGDITETAFGGEQFDYVICHGVFSWVPRPAQDAILRICGGALTRGGVAMISYNVLPGWHTHAVVRDMCLRHAGNAGSPRERVVRVRELLEQLAATARSNDPYGLILRTEAARLAKRPASYILGEFLTEHNSPCHFRDFCERAAANGLAYLSETDVPSSVPELFMPDAADRIRTMAGNDPASMQQYTDFFSGRSFRRSLVVRTEHAATRLQSINSDHLGGLHCAGKLRFDASAGDIHTAVFRDHRDRAFAVKGDIVKGALIRLGERYPATATTAELAATSLASSPDEAQRAITAAVFELVTAGRATISSQPLRVGQARSTFPTAWEFARAEAATAQPWVTSLNHTAVVLTPILKLLLGHMSGHNDRNQLTAILVDAIRAGHIQRSELLTVDDAPHDAAPIPAAAVCVERALEYCALNALLEPS